MILAAAFFAGQAIARPAATPKPIPAPAELIRARFECSNASTISECRGKLRVAYRDLAWQKHARKRLQRRLQALQTPVQHLAAWSCIHSKEGAWNDTQDPYWGGLQMDRSFMQTYGPDMIAKYHGWAHLWTPRDQMIVAERAYDAGRGYAPWPATSRMCGLR